MRVKWHGDEDAASKVTSKTIDNPGSDWEFRENDSPNDNKKSEHTIYYVSKDKKRTMIRLGEFVSKSIRDNNSVDVQVVCRVTDPQVLLGAQPNNFINKVTHPKNEIEKTYIICESFELLIDSINLFLSLASNHFISSKYF